MVLLMATLRNRSIFLGQDVLGDSRNASMLLHFFSRYCTFLASPRYYGCKFGSDQLEAISFQEPMMGHRTGLA